MALEIIGMYGAMSGGTQNALAQIDIPQSGVLLGIDWDMHALLDADNEVLQIELSFIATNLLTISDVRGRISSISSGAVVLTSVGVNSVSVQKWIGPFELSLSAGERIYLHSVAQAGIAGDVRCNLHFDGGATATRRSQRR